MSLTLFLCKHYPPPPPPLSWTLHNRLKPRCIAPLFPPQLVSKISLISLPPHSPPAPWEEQKSHLGSSHAVGWGGPAGSLAFGGMFQHSVRVTVGCHLLRVGKGLFPFSSAPGKTGPAGPQPATGGQDQGHRHYLIWPQGSHNQPPLTMKGIFIRSQMQLGLSQGHRSPQGEVPAEKVAGCCRLGSPSPVPPVEAPHPEFWGAHRTGQPQCGTPPPVLPS